LDWLKLKLATPCLQTIDSSNLDSAWVHRWELFVRRRLEVGVISFPKLDYSVLSLHPELYSCTCFAVHTIHSVNRHAAWGEEHSCFVRCKDDLASALGCSPPWFYQRPMRQLAVALHFVHSLTAAAIFKSQQQNYSAHCQTPTSRDPDCIGRLYSRRDQTPIQRNVCDQPTSLRFPPLLLHVLVTVWKFLHTVHAQLDLQLLLLIH
jgi:hypothetical protein